MEPAKCLLSRPVCFDVSAISVFLVRTWLLFCKTSFPSFPASFGGNVTSIHVTDDTLSASLDVSQYKADDLKVSVVDQSIVVAGKHPEKPDEFGSIERHFIRKFNLPRGVQPEGVSSSLTSDGILTIQAVPLRPKEGSPVRAIPIKIVSGNSDPTSPTQDGKTDEHK